ncbi:MAG: GntR family transcriptional regulator [Acidimicrobiales bacterium]
MKLTVDHRSAVPPFEQLRVQITQQVARGTLSPGDRLPTVRQLAADLGIAPGTVQRTYRELEAQGVVITRGRHGTEVASPKGRRLTSDRRTALRRAARQFFDFADSIGAQQPEVDDALRSARR